MGDLAVAPMLEAFRSPGSRECAWAEFLELYSALLYQTARVCTSNEDSAADCYVYICEGLAGNCFRRLLKFNPEGSASFNTWLRIVARNLCFDWHRSQSGRPRLFKCFQNLSPLERDVYKARIEQGISQLETLHLVQPRFPGVRLSDISEIEGRLQRSLTSRQQWIVGTRRQPELMAIKTVADEEHETAVLDIADPSPSQEVQVVNEEEQRQVRLLLRSLSAHERLILQLRFEQELTLGEIARLTGLRDAQSVHRSLGAVLKKLRHAMVMCVPEV